MRAARLVLLLLVAASAWAADPAAREPPASSAVPVTSAAQLSRLTRDTARSLAGARAVRGRFVQRRFLAGLAAPLESRGEFLFARDLGIEWHTAQPFDSQFVLTHDTMTQRDEGGDAVRVSAADQPALTVVSRVFFALFALDYDALSQDFSMTAETTDPRQPWRLLLRPRTAALASVFRQATISGDATVKTVVLSDANGDATHIELRDVQYDPRGVTADERRRF
jgi:hypothetical protein